MREIKHRLLSHNKKVVGYEKWYPGSWNTEWSGYQASPGWLYSIDGEKWSPEYIEHRYKDTYTGLKDKNGQEIYEGDIVGILDITTRQAPYIGDVRWNEIVTGYEAFSPELSYGLFLHPHPMMQADIVPELKIYLGRADQRTIEVIGNIYQNPELLEG